MRYCFLAFIVCITFVMVSAGMDDRSCSELYQFFVDKHIIPNNHQTLDAFCKNQIDGEYLDTINRIDCEELNLDLNHCEKLHGYLSKIRSLPSSKFKDFWDWRVHNKRISDYWLLPLSHSPRSLIFYLYFRSNDALVFQWFNDQPLHFLPLCVITPSFVTWYMWDSDAITKYPDSKAQSFVFECALFWGGISEGLIFLHFLNLLRKSYFGEKCDEASSTRARKDLRELMWSSVILIAVCHLFACFHYYLFYLPFNIVFYFHLRVLWPLNSLMYPLVIWAMPTFARMSLCSMIDPIINPIRHTKTQ